MDIIQTILKDSNYHLALFTKKEIEDLQETIFTKITRGKETPYINCIVRKKDIQLKPEEIVRQLYAARLINQYGYTKKRIKFEYSVTFGREKKSADIVILDKDRPDAAYIIIELKKPKLKDGKNQLRSYCNATGAPIGVWTNGEQISHYHRKDPNYFEDITDIPKEKQSLKDILSERFTLKDLISKDKIANERKSLKDIILEMEDEVLANAGVDVFEEVFKLIFTKLYDEFGSKKDKANIEFYLDQNLDDEEKGDYDKLKETLIGLNDKKFCDKKEIKIPGIHYVPCATLISIKGAVGDFSIVYKDAEKTKQKTVAAIIVAEGAMTAHEEMIPHLSKVHLYSLNRFLDYAKNKQEEIPQTLVFWLDYSQPQYKTFSRTALLTAIKLSRKGRQITFIMNKMLVHKLEGQRLYDQARKQGIRFLRIDTPEDVSIKQENEKISFALKEKTLKNVIISFESDWLIIPETVQPSDKNSMIATLLKDQLDCEKYLQSANVRHRPTNSPRKGIFYTGSCHDETDDLDQNIELDLILNSIQKINDKQEVSSPIDIKINTKKCKRCLTCLRTCPHGAIVLDNNMCPFIVATACFSCGLCLSNCPAFAIESKTFCDASYVDLVSKDDIIVFACERSGALAAGDDEYDTYIKIQKVACVCRISQNILLKALEKGAKKIVLAGCHPDNCRSIKGSQTALFREKHITRLPGFENDCITFFPIAANESVKFKTFLAKEFIAN
ncbi:MAG: type I restriction enzyme HsdR N-terminal domain-containing protein [Desulfobacula sp.]|nr:type I restriction enzyme HsdR N-terminal domain-containing protein [Desulfobacula sp.]